MNHDFKNYHDNRAFQYHNNNTLKGKAAAKLSAKPLDDGILDAVIVQHHQIGWKPPTGMAEGDIRGSTRSTCKHHQRLHTARQRHNATQTPEMPSVWSHKPHPCACEDSCCFKHTHADIHADMSCHCHITHHCHRYSPAQGGAGGLGNDTGAGRSGRQSKREHCERRRLHTSNNREPHRTHHEHRHRHHHHHHYRQRCADLPLSYTKSSLNTSDEQLNSKQPRAHHQQIAIEIDAATMTEDNTSTATSNFAYKMAPDSNEPIIMAPIHHDRQASSRRRDSSNSNTTVDTDELSHGGDEDDEEVAIAGDVEEEEASITPRAICCDDVRKGKARDLLHVRNECVRIKRKRFIAESQDYSSSCSRCSSCSCQQDRTSSCSSIEDFATGERPHEFTVSAECHHCSLQRQSTGSTVEDEDELATSAAALRLNDGPTASTQPLVPETTDTGSNRTSRPSSASFCSCDSNSCCCYSCSCDECEARQMHTARDATFTPNSPTEELHSSTLTPLTNPNSNASTPIVDEADVTLRSFSHALEDASSLSQSAEYFSLSSCNPQSQATPVHSPTHKATARATPPVAAIAEVPTVSMASGRKPCKHQYSKHHRHKRAKSPVDAYL